MSRMGFRVQPRNRGAADVHHFVSQSAKKSAHDVALPLTQRDPARVVREQDNL